MPKPRLPHLIHKRHGKINMYVLIMDHDFELKKPMERKNLLTIICLPLNKIIQTRLPENSFDWCLHQYLQSMQWHNQSKTTKKLSIEF